MYRSLCLGLDIGTTTISAVVMDPVEKCVIESCTVRSGADLPGEHPWEKTQDAALIERRVLHLARDLRGRYPAIASVGLTGQMHGIVYVDEQGVPVSPLYTWQDERAAQGRSSVCEQLFAKTGWKVAPGYGLATHCALVQAGAVPAGAKKLCTIMDYLAFVLCGRKEQTMHATNAASLGFFDAANGCFDAEAIAAGGIDADLLLPVTAGCDGLGEWEGIPVSVAIGDNQASFLGSVASPEDGALANFGTGSQISRLTHDPHAAGDPSLEIRPFLGRTFLICGSALCGGRAYALLERFFHAFALACGSQEDDCYAVLNALAAQGMADPLHVEPTFCGTRADPAVRGVISGIDQHNFTPAALAAGTLMGMARELRDMLDRMPGEPIRRLVASGNAVRKNPALVQALETVFGLPVIIPAHQEEAAFGAALFGAAAAGLTQL